MNRLEILAATQDVDRARKVAESVGGRLLWDAREDASLPFRALVSAVTDDLETLLEVADVGAYLVLRRVILPRKRLSAEEPGPGQPLVGTIALYTMVRREDLSHREADRHWRDQHVPLALEHHVAMSHYTQLSVVHRFHGPGWDGFALCGFDSLDDLRNRFFETEQGRIAIREDVARFADAARSPRRLIATETVYE